MLLPDSATVRGPLVELPEEDQDGDEDHGEDEDHDKDDDDEIRPLCLSGNLDGPLSRCRAAVI